MTTKTRTPILLIFLMAGCASKPTIHKEDPIYQALLSTASEVNQKLNLISQMDKARGKSTYFKTVKDDVVSYKFEIIGRTPPLPPIIIINKTKVRFIDLFRDVAAQSGQNINIRIDESLKTISLIYRN